MVCLVCREWIAEAPAFVQVNKEFVILRKSSVFCYASNSDPWDHGGAGYWRSIFSLELMDELELKITGYEGWERREWFAMFCKPCLAMQKNLQFSYGVGVLACLSTSACSTDCQ